jgi:hypothetical protein
MDRLTILAEIIKETIKINNRFLERSLEKKNSYNFRRRYSSSRKKYRDFIKLDAIYRKPQFFKEKRGKRRQKGLYYEYGLPGYQAASYKQKKGKGFQKKHNVSTAARILKAALRPDPEG